MRPSVKVLASSSAIFGTQCSTISSLLSLASVELAGVLVYDFFLNLVMQMGCREDIFMVYAIGFNIIIIISFKSFD
jgi:uncharacterized protein YebE (UPF0316 family)